MIQVHWFPLLCAFAGVAFAFYEHGRRIQHDEDNAKTEKE